LKRQEKRSGKKLIYVPESLIEKMAETARREGRSLTSLVEEALQQALMTRKLGYNPNEALEQLRVLKAQRTLGATFLPTDVLTHLMSHINDEEKMKKLKMKWRMSGAWHGNYLKEEFEDPVKAFKAFLEATRWDLTEVKLKSERDNFKLSIISTVLTEEETELLMEYVESVIQSMGYETIKRNHMKGMIILEFRSPQAPSQA